MEIVLKSRGDIERIRPLVSWLDRPAIDHVVVLLPWLDGVEQRRLAKRFKFLFNDCGCLWGVPAFLAAFGWLLSTAIHTDGFSWITLGYAFLVGSVAAFAAKLVGLAWSY